uniref:Uncharacterized protein n=1 Tax=Vespula pensylvanica TaxID=30213 RepID=A0A834N139_VESPE|nr:hypothetical protein H0235_017495 [Vespula pensylvanica]
MGFAYLARALVSELQVCKIKELHVGSESALETSRAGNYLVDERNRTFRGCRHSAESHKMKEEKREESATLSTADFPGEIHGLFSEQSKFVPRVNTRSIIEWDRPLIICRLLMPMKISKLGPRTSEHERSYGKAKMLLIGIGNFEHEKVGRSSLDENLSCLDNNYENWILSTIWKSSNVIREAYKELKRPKLKSDEILQRSYKLIIKLLQQLLTNKNIINDDMKYKKIAKDYDDKMQTMKKIKKDEKRFYDVDIADNDLNIFVSEPEYTNMSKIYPILQLHLTKDFVLTRLCFDGINCLNENQSLIESNELRIESKISDKGSYETSALFWIMKSITCHNNHQLWNKIHGL